MNTNMMRIELSTCRACATSSDCPVVGSLPFSVSDEFLLLLHPLQHMPLVDFHQPKQM